MLQVLFELMLRKAKGMLKTDARVVLKDGKVWTTNTTVVLYWEEYSRMARRKPSAIGTALKQLADAERYVQFDAETRRKARGIPLETFVDAGVAELEDLVELQEMMTSD